MYLSTSDAISASRASWRYYHIAGKQNAREAKSQKDAKKMVGSRAGRGVECVFGLFALIVLGGCSATTQKVVTQTPAGISYEDVADAAQRHCRKAGKDARQTSLAIAPSGDLWTSFSCV